MISLRYLGASVLLAILIIEILYLFSLLLRVTTLAIVLLSIPRAVLEIGLRRRPLRRQDPTRPLEIYLLLVPLSISLKCGLLNVRPGILPREFQHWAIKIDDWIYEVCRVSEKGKDVYRMQCRKYTSLEQWRNCPVEIKHFGRAKYAEISRQDLAEVIWKCYHREKYCIVDQNCQNFARIFFELVRDPKYIAGDGNIFPLTIHGKITRLYDRAAELYCKTVWKSNVYKKAIEKDVEWLQRAVKALEESEKMFKRENGGWMVWKTPQSVGDTIRAMSKAGS